MDENRYEKKKADVAAIIEELKALYPDGICSLDYRKDYELLFSVDWPPSVLTERVNKVTPALYARFPTLESLANAEIAEVEQYIHSTGFFRAKAKDIVLASQMLLREYGGKVPNTMEDLLKLPGVGRKTANLILETCTTPPAWWWRTPTASVSRSAWLTDGSKDPTKVRMQLEEDPASRGVQ